MSKPGPCRRTQQRIVHCSPEEREAIRASARAAGKTVSRHVLDLARADDGCRHPLVLSDEEQRELLDCPRCVNGFVRALRQPLPEYGGLTLPGVIARLSEGQE